MGKSSLRLQEELFDYKVFQWHSRGQRFDPAYLHHRSLENHSVFVDKAVNQIITAAESAMGEKLSCKATD